MKKHLYLFTLLLLLLAKNTTAQVADSIHVSHYSIHLTQINTDSRIITGWTEATIHSKLNSLHSFSLELKALVVDSVYLNDTNASFTQSDDLVHVLLQQPVDEGTIFTVKVWYHGTPFHESWGGFHWDGAYAFNLGVGFVSIPHNLGKTWFPCVDNFTDRATYDFYITVNNSKKAVCGGLLQDVQPVNDSTSTWHWKLNHAIPTYLASVATGDYALVSDEYIGIEDTIPISIYVHPADTSKVAGSFVNLKTTLRFFENQFGAYPFGRVGYIGTAIGAMEHAGNIAYPNFAINGNTTEQSLYSHELSHMWFGDKVTCTRAEEMWLNEGWASFCEMYYLEGLGEHDEYVSEMQDRNYKVLKQTAFTDHGYWALAEVPQQYTYGSTSYDKGAVVVNTLKNYLGDSLFSQAITAYLNHFAYRSVSSRDMQQFLTDYTGIDMKPFFDAWVFTPGTPHFSIDSVRTISKDEGYLINIYERQKYRGADYLADNNILEIGYLKNDFTLQTDTIHFSGKTGHSVKQLSFQPRAVLMDPFAKTADATTDDIKLFTHPEGYDFKRTFFNLEVNEINDTAWLRVTHNWVAPDSIKHPVAGLRISPNRYWTVEGVVPAGMASTGRFYFSNSNYLDGDMHLSSTDSVMILYRPSTKADWQYVPQTILGGPTIGYLYVDNIKPGEYVLAALNRNHLGVNGKSDKTGFTIYPNPTNGKVSIVFPERGAYKITITDTKGNLLDSTNFKGKTKRFHIKTPVSGTLIFSVQKNGQFLGSKKVIYVK